MSLFSSVREACCSSNTSLTVPFDFPIISGVALTASCPRRSDGITAEAEPGKHLAWRSQSVDLERLGAFLDLKQHGETL